MNTTEISAEERLLNEQTEHLSQKLDETEDVYTKLLALENEKQRAIIDRAPAKVMELLDDERGLVALATALEGDLLALRDEIGSGLGDIPASGGEPITLREIAEALGTPRRPGDSRAGDSRQLEQVKVEQEKVEQVKVDQVTGDNLNLSTVPLFNCSPFQIAGTLEDKRHNILHLATRLRNVSQTNFLLLKQCSTLLEEIIRGALTVTGEDPAPKTYGAAGGPASPARRGGNGTVGAMMDVIAGD